MFCYIYCGLQLFRIIVVSDIARDVTLELAGRPHNNGPEDTIQQLQTMIAEARSSGGFGTSSAEPSASSGPSSSHSAKSDEDLKNLQNEVLQSQV